MSKVSFQARRQARFFLVQAIYQWQLADTPVTELLLQFAAQEQFKKADQTYFQEALPLVIAEAAQLDAFYEPYLDRALHDLDPIEQAIMRLACYELAHRLDLPYRVVINEALELAKIFGAVDSHKYINGVLDKVAVKLRPLEFNQ